MGTPLSAQHFFTVRGRGFNDVQWKNLTSAAAKIIDRAKAAGAKVSLESDATHVLVASEDGGGPLVIWKVGEPNVAKEVTASGQFDVVVQTLFAVIKKIAPSIFEMTCPDGRDYRQVLARGEPSKWKKMKQHGHAAESKEEAFLSAVSKKTWHHPDTGNNVEFVSLPKKEQTKIRHQWELEYGRHIDEAEDKAKKEVDEAKDAIHDLDRAQDKATAKPKRKASEGTMKSIDRTIFRAAIRVASKTNDVALKRELLRILRDASCGDGPMACGDVPGIACGDGPMACGDDPMMARHEEGKDVDVGTWLRENGHPEAAAKWDHHEGEIGSKSAAVFPDIHRLAWEHVVVFARSRPQSKTATSSTSRRIAAANKIAEQWIQDAIKRPGRVREYLGIPEGETIPMGKLNAAIAKVKDTGNKSLLAALMLAKRLKGKD